MKKLLVLFFFILLLLLAGVFQRDEGATFFLVFGPVEGTIVTINGQSFDARGVAMTLNVTEAIFLGENSITVQFPKMESWLEHGYTYEAAIRVYAVRGGISSDDQKILFDEIFSIDGVERIELRREFHVDHL